MKAGAAVGADPSASESELALIDGYWRACNYVAVCMIYLQDNQLLREPLRGEHVKQRLLGHWGSSPGLAFMYVHLSRAIVRHDLDAIFIAGPGHGAPGVLAPVYLEGTYGEVYPDKGPGIEGLRRFCRAFSFPGGIGSHCTPELPGSIHEGGELGYSLAHAFGAALDNPDLLVAVAIGDGEAETGPLATAWHSNKFLNPARDGAVLPILHLNGYKIDNPTILARIPERELRALFHGYGYKPYIVAGHDPMTMHHDMVRTMDACVRDIRRAQKSARDGGAGRPRWPMIILKSPKGWTGPAFVDGAQVADHWRSHQVPLADARVNAAHLAQLEGWLRSYRPDTLFDADGRLVARLENIAPVGRRRMSANQHANGGRLMRPLRLPDFREYAVAVDRPGGCEFENTRRLGAYLRDVLRLNRDNFRVFGPDETRSNRLDAVYAASKKTWMAELLDSDLDGGELAPDGCVMEMLSEHTLEGWLEGYLLTGRHGFLSTYEAFAHVIDSMFNQHAKWLDSCEDIPWRAPVASLNLLITSTVWRQDHNGFTHQDPGFLDVVVNKSPRVTRIYLPPDANCLLAIADRCLRTTNDINVIVSDKQVHLQYLDMDAAIGHCTKGIGLWEWASSDRGVEPDIVIAACGDVATREALAATALLREHVPQLKVRFVNVVDLYTLTPPHEHPHGLPDRDFDALFTSDRPIIFNFHGYPWLIHRLSYRRTNHGNLHVRGYKEKGSICTPLELAIRNQVDRFSLAIDAIDRVPPLRDTCAHTRELFRNTQIDCLEHAHRHGVDRDSERHWKWPG